MARINIDEKWKTDPRRTALAKRIGGRAADGMLVEITWLVLAHRGQPIPLKEFQFIENMTDWVECGLATIDGDFVRVAGADAYEDFFNKQRENGKKGGRPIKAKLTQKNPTGTQKKPKKPSSSSSSSSSSSISNSNTGVAILEKSPPENLVAVYCGLWKEKNGKSPTLRGKDAGQLNQLAKELGQGRACELIRVYFAMPDPFFIKRGYDVSSFVSNLSAIQQFEASKKILTSKVIEDIENQVDKIQGTDKRPRRDLSELEAERRAQLQIASGGDHGDNA